MQHFILDTNIILRDPSILAKSSNETRILIPEAVILELAARSSKNESIRPTLALVQEALAHGVYRIGLPDPNALNSMAIQDAVLTRVSAADLIILKSVEYYINHLVGASDSKNAFFVTEDKVLFQQAKALGINVLDYAELKAALQNVSISDHLIDERGFDASRIRKRAEIRGFVLGTGSGVLASIVASLAAANFKLIVATINVWGTIIILPLLGVFLYWWRSRYRLSYGIAEFVFGLIATLGVFIPQFDYTRLNALNVVQVVAGLYVIVRGLDNIGVGLKGTRVETMWSRVFGE